MPGWVRWTLAAGVAALVTAGPAAFYRCVYVHGKRLREVSPGRVYRSGQMTEDGFIDAVGRLGIHTIINLQDEYPDPDISRDCLGVRTVKESDLCRRLGVRYVFLRPDLVARRQVPEHRPRAINEFLTLMDDPSAYPVLLHCKAGLHRTGVMVAVYRMEYDGWAPQQALAELRDNGFGLWASTSANDYVTQYILTYRRSVRGR
jgi:tyrosine-protein phosphatase SIW14